MSIQAFFSEFSKSSPIKKILWAVLVLGLVWIVVLFVWDKPKSQKIQPSLQEEKRKNYAGFDIGASISNIDAPEEPPNVKPPGSQQPRNLKVKMGIYVKTEDRKEMPKETEKTKEKGEKELGVNSGTRIPALLTHRLFSFNLEAPVLAKVTEDVLAEGKPVIPKGSLFLGEASVLKSVDRINIRFDKFITPDGKEIPLRAIALSSDGSSGLKGKVDKQRSKALFKAMGEGVLGGVALLSGGLSSSAYSLQDAMRVNASQGLVNMAERDLSDIKTEVSITVEAFTPFQILILERI